MNTEPNMIEISEEKFFLKTKRSLGLMSEMDEEIQMYVESFLFWSSAQIKQEPLLIDFNIFPINLSSQTLLFHGVLNFVLVHFK